MATTVTSRPKAGVRADHIFFLLMAVMVLAAVLLGFFQSYFLAGMLRAKLPNVLVHIHGAFFIFWIFLLVIQSILIVIRRVKWHIKLGVLALVLPPIMVVLGTLTVVDSIRRAGTGVPAGLLLVADIEQVLLFAGLTLWGWRARRDNAAHKRLMILATMAMLGPAIDRWPLHAPIVGVMAIYLGFPLLIVIYDLFSMRRIHRATAIGFALIAGAMLSGLPLSQTAVIQRAVSWIQHG